jgi:hypothetical protein
LRRAHRSGRNAADLNVTQGARVLPEEHYNHDDASEQVSVLEALDDITTTIEAIVLSFGDEQTREAYFVVADEYGAFAETVPEEPEQRTSVQTAKLDELEKRLEAAFEPILQASPDHIRKLYEAVRAAVDAEEASEL